METEQAVELDGGIVLYANGNPDPDGSQQHGWGTEQSQDGSGAQQDDACSSMVVEQPQNPLANVQQQKQQYIAWFRTHIPALAGLELDNTGSVAPDTLAALAPYADLQVPQLVTGIQKASGAHSYLSNLKYWAECVRELERKLRAVQEQAQEASSPAADLDGYKTGMHEATQALGAAVYAASLVAYWAQTVADVAELTQAASTIDGRMQQCRYELYTRLTTDANTLLEACHWPPPLVQPKGLPAAPPLANGGPGHAGPMSDKPHENGIGEQHEDGSAQGTNGAGDISPHAGTEQQPQVFTGFAADSERLSRLVAVLTCLTGVQQAVEPAGFAPPDANMVGYEDTAAGGTQQQHKEVPLLWAATCLAGPLQARLQVHFQPDQGVGRLDQPDWVFRLVMGLVKEHADHMAVLQPVLVDSELGGRTHMVVEWARAMREATKAVLRTARFPALVELWEERQDIHTCKLWAGQVEAMLAFDRQLAPYLGAPLSMQTSAAPLPEALLPGSVMAAITDDPNLMETWVAVLRHQAIHKLETAMEDKDAWQVSPSLLPDSQPLSGVPPLPPPPGSTREFNPPRLADAVAESMAQLVQLSAQLPTADTQRAVLDNVGGPLLIRTRDELRTAFNQASEYQGLASKAGAPWAGACVSAARYLHHVVSELLAGPALHRLHTGTAGGAATAHAGVNSTQTSPGMPQGHYPSPVKGLLGDVVVRHSFTPATWDPPVLSAAVTALGALHREMCLRTARDVSVLFGKGAAVYRSEVEAAVQYLTHTGPSGTVSPLLLPALTALEAGLAYLSGPLDAPSFRDIWRAVSVPLNRFMFNYIATEARFTAAGAEQFAVDCSGMVACFAPYTKRPAAHFRETLAASRLLSLSEDDASEAVRRASAASVAQVPCYKEPWLAKMGVGALLPAQIVAVIERRV